MMDRRGFIGCAAAAAVLPPVHTSAPLIGSVPAILDGTFVIGTLKETGKFTVTDLTVARQQFSAGMLSSYVEIKR